MFLRGRAAYRLKILGGCNDLNPPKRGSKGVMARVDECDDFM